MLHGWGVNASIWDRILPELDPLFDLTIIDLPGYGSDTDYCEGNSLSTIANVVLSRAPTTAPWIAWSLGGTIAMEAARTSPERISKLQLISSTPRFVTDSTWKHGADPSVLGTFEEDFSNDFEKALGKFLKLQTLSSDRAKGRDNLRLARQLTQEQLQQKRPTARTLNEGLRILADTDLRSVLSEIKVPTQIVTGSHDHVVQASASRYLSEQLPNCHSYHEFECGHLPFLQNSSEYIEALNSFINA